MDCHVCNKPILQGKGPCYFCVCPNDHCVCLECTPTVELICVSCNSTECKLIEANMTASNESGADESSLEFKEEAMHSRTDEEQATEETAEITLKESFTTFYAYSDDQHIYLKCKPSVSFICDCCKSTTSETTPSNVSFTSENVSLVSSSVAYSSTLQPCQEKVAEHSDVKEKAAEKAKEEIQGVKPEKPLQKTAATQTPALIHHILEIKTCSCLDKGHAKNINEILKNINCDLAKMCSFCNAKYTDVEE